MAPSSRVDAFQQRHPWVGFPLAVAYKTFDDQGSYLAALMTYYAFLSLFPLLLLLASVLGFFLQDDPELQQRLLDSALGQFPVVGDQLGDPQGLQGSRTTVTIAFLASLYGALGVAQAAQNAMNVIWAVPKNKRPNPLLSRLRSLLLLVTAGLMVIATTVLSTLGSSGLFGDGPLGGAVFTLLSVALNVGVLLVALQLATALPLTIGELLPGALLGGVLWKVLQKFGADYVDQVVRGASDTNGTFAFVFGLIAWVFLLSMTLVLCVEVNVVRARRLHPRSLLTPFTDHVDLTAADQRAYRQYAAAQRAKGFEKVDVTFEHDGQYASAQREREQDGASPP